MMHQERNPMPNDPQERELEVDFKVLDEAVKNVLSASSQPKRKPSPKH